MEKWVCNTDNHTAHIDSDSRDVRLHITGDFEDYEHREVYIKNLTRKLNRAEGARKRTAGYKARIATLEAQLQVAQSKLDEVHEWAVCGCIATPEDMMQNLPRIIEITSGEE